MNFQIIESPIHFNLIGFSSQVENKQYGEFGLRLMNQLWQVIKEAKIPTTGINHWVYLPDHRMFVGTELENPKLPKVSAQLESLKFEVQRYLKYVHVGPYQALPQMWKQLKDELANRAEIISAPSLEIYGHHCADPSKSETTILIGLETKNQN